MDLPLPPNILGQHLGLALGARGQCLAFLANPVKDPISMPLYVKDPISMALYAVFDYTTSLYINIGRVKGDSELKEKK